MTARIAVLASGGGTNLQALLDHFDALGAARSGEVIFVASNRAQAGALDRARRHHLPAYHISAQDAEMLLRLLDEHRIDMIALAGYLKLIPGPVIDRYRGRIINVHPGPLPAFGGPGMFGTHVHAAVLAAGVSQTGVSVHFVDERYDHGTLIAQWPVPVLPGDTAETLGARVLAAEHILYPRIVDALAAVLVTQRASGERVSGA